MYPQAAVPARPLADRAAQSVAVVRLRTGLGDLLCTVPALRALRRHRPDVRVTMVTFAEMAPVVERLRRWVDDLLPFPGWPGIPERPPRFADIPGFIAAARARRFDVAIQAYGGQAPANEVTLAIGARHTCGFFTPGAWKADLRTHLPYPFRYHEADRLGALFEFLGTGPIERRLEFPVTSEDRERAAAVRAEHALVPGRYAVVHPGATAPSRRWPAERFAAVADGLAARGLAMALTGVAGEEATVVAAVRAAMSSAAVDLCGRTELGTLAALLEDAAVVVGNDTGIAQVAIAVGTPTVTIFLAGDPARWAGFDTARHRNAVGAVTCHPCGLLACPIDFRCAAAVDPGAVLELADQAIASSRTDVVRTSSPST